MRKPARTWLLVVGVIVVLLVLSAAPSHAWSRHVGGCIFIDVWPGFWWAPAYPRYWYRPYYYPPAPVIVQQPHLCIQQAPAPRAAATYWYYCPSAKTYYSEVQSCAEPWIPVRPRNS